MATVIMFWVLRDKTGGKDKLEACRQGDQGGPSRRRGKLEACPTFDVGERVRGSVVEVQSVHLEVEPFARKTEVLGCLGDIAG